MGRMYAAIIVSASNGVKIIYLAWSSGPASRSLPPRFYEGLRVISHRL